MEPVVVARVAAALGVVGSEEAELVVVEQVAEAKEEAVLEVEATVEAVMVVEVATAVAR